MQSTSNIFTHLFGLLTVSDLLALLLLLIKPIRRYAGYWLIGTSCYFIVFLWVISVIITNYFFGLFPTIFAAFTLLGSLVLAIIGFIIHDISGLWSYLYFFLPTIVAFYAGNFAINSKATPLPHYDDHTPKATTPEPTMMKISDLTVTGDRQQIQQRSHKALVRLQNNNPGFFCKNCGEWFQPQPDQWIFHELCDTCFTAFDSQKMLGRRSTPLANRTALYFEDVDDWIRHNTQPQKQPHNKSLSL